MLGSWTTPLSCLIGIFPVGQTILNESDARLDLKLMELELQKWSMKSREAYQAQMACAMKLKHEVISLRALVSSQQDLIRSLTQDLQQLSANKFLIGKSSMIFWWQ